MSNLSSGLTFDLQYRPMMMAALFTPIKAAASASVTLDQPLLPPKELMEGSGLVGADKREK